MSFRFKVKSIYTGDVRLRFFPKTLLCIKFDQNIPKIQKAKPDRWTDKFTFVQEVILNRLKKQDGQTSLSRSRKRS